MRKSVIAILMMIAAFTACERAVHAQATVNIVDTLTQGSPPTAVAGRLVITWESFTSAEALPVPGGYKTVDVGASGALTVALVPNVGATPSGTSYNVEYFLPGAHFTETWVVGAPPGPYTIPQVRVVSVPSVGVSVLGSQISGPVASSVIPTTHRRRTCNIVVGADNATSPLVDADLAPQGHQCWIYAAATIVEMNVSADAGTPSISVARNRAGALASITAAPLQTAAAGGIACANAAGSGLGLDGVTTCAVALTTTALAAGDFLDLNGGVAGGTAKRVSLAVTFTID